MFQSVRESSSVAKKDRLEHVKSHWKKSEIHCFSRSTTQSVLVQPNMVADISDNFKPPSKKVLATTWGYMLLPISRGCYPSDFYLM